MKSRILTSIFFLFATNCTFASGNVSADMQQFLNDSLQDHTAPGAVMLISNEKVGIKTFATGESDIKTHTPMHADDTFRIASMSKTFMAAAILKLVDQGKLNLTDKISHWLSASVDLKRIPNGTELTVKDLLQMRSGIPDYYQSDEYHELFSANPKHIVTAKEVITTVYDKKPLFSPGEKYNYSNTNYVLLQLILEKITGKSLSQALNNLIIQPLHLSHTRVNDEKNFASSKDKTLTTHGYTMDDHHHFVDITKKFDGNGLGDGCIITNVFDMEKFLQALLIDKTLISPKELKQMLSFKDDYGLGISAERTPSGTYYTHNGDASGYEGQYYLDKDNNLVIILTNCDDAKFIEDLSDKVYQRL